MVLPIREAAASLRARPVRSIFTALGTTIGVAAFVATACIAETARAQLSARFDALEATQITVEYPAEGPYPHGFSTSGIESLRTLNGVQSAGEYWDVSAEGGDVSVSASFHPDPDAAVLSQVAVVAADPGALDSWSLGIGRGRTYDDFHERRSERVALLGSAAAIKLGVSRVDNRPAIVIGGILFNVIGIVESSPRNPLLLSSVLVPTATALTTFPDAQPDARVIIHTADGAAQLVARQARIALRPDQPDLLRVLAPPDPRTLRRQIEADAVRIVYAVSGVALLMGAIGIATSAALSVVERRHEIGLRKSLGASSRDIWHLIAQETALLGGVAGLVGTVIGLIVLTCYSLVQGWVPTGNPALIAGAPPAGVLVGAIAGVVPALRASRTPPAVTLRN